MLITKFNNINNRSSYFNNLLYFQFYLFYFKYSYLTNLFEKNNKFVVKKLLFWKITTYKYNFWNKFIFNNTNLLNKRIVSVNNLDYLEDFLITKKFSIRNNLLIFFNYSRVLSKVKIFNELLIGILYYNYKFMIISDDHFRNEVVSFNENFKYFNNNYLFFKEFFTAKVSFSVKLDTFFMKLSKDKRFVFMAINNSNLVVFLKRWNLFSFGFLSFIKNNANASFTLPIYVKNIYINYSLILYLYLYKKYINNLILLRYFNFIVRFKYLLDIKLLNSA